MDACPEVAQLLAQRDGAKGTGGAATRPPLRADTNVIVGECVMNAWKNDTEQLKPSDIILDNGATMHVFGDNVYHVTDQYVGETVILTGLGGTRYSQLRGTVPAFDEVVLIPEAKFNILSLSRAEDEGCTVTYLNRAFQVTTPTGQRFDFVRRANLYVLQTPEHVLSVRGEEVTLTPEQLASVQRVGKLLAYVSASSLKDKIKTNGIAGSDVTVDMILRCMRSTAHP